MLALEVFVPLFSNDFPSCRLIQGGLNFYQLLEGRGMLLLELTQILLEDGVILLELNMFSSQACELFRKIAKFGFSLLPSHGSFRGLTFHYSRMLAKDSELLLHFCHSLLKLGILPFNYLEPLSRGPRILGFGDFLRPLSQGPDVLDFRDFSEVPVYQCTSEEALQLKSTSLDKKSFEGEGIHQNTYQELEGQHLLGHATSKYITLHLKFVVINQVQDGLEGVAFQIPTELGQFSSDLPVSPFGLNLC